MKLLPEDRQRRLPHRRRLAPLLLLLAAAAAACRAAPVAAPPTAAATASVTNPAQLTPTAALAPTTPPAAAAPPAGTAPPTPTAAAAPPASATPPSAATTPPGASGARATPVATAVDLAGRVASDLPGTPLALGRAVTSLISSDGKPRDVYALALGAGGMLDVDVSANRADYSVLLLPPGATTVVRTLGTFQGSTLCTFQQQCRQIAPTGAPGAYALVLEAQGPAVRYTLRTREN